MIKMGVLNLAAAQRVALLGQLFGFLSEYSFDGQVFNETMRYAARSILSGFLTVA